MERGQEHREQADTETEVNVGGAPEIADETPHDYGGIGQKLGEVDLDAAGDVGADPPGGLGLDIGGGSAGLGQNAEG